MSLAHNALFNLGGALLPALAALLTVPVLVASLGSSAYGVLVLVSSIVGYFAILDINATAGSVKYIAQHRAEGDEARVRQVLSFGGALYLGIGAVGGVLIALFAEPLARSGFRVPPDLQAEATLALRWSGVAFLLGQVQAYLHSVPQALQRYDLSGRLEAVFGTGVALLSMAAAWAGAGLVGVVIVRLALSGVNVAVLLVLLRRLLPGATWQRPDGRTLGEVARFSAFSYLARLAAISAAHTDKLLVGALVDMRSLAYYSVPVLLVGRVHALAFRLAQVMFPHASALAAAQRRDALRHDYLHATRYVSFVNAALMVMLVGLAPEVLHHWAGAEFGRAAVPVMLLVAVAICLDSLTGLPTLVNDGLGHPQVSGTAAVLRAAIGALVSWLAIRSHGILGAAAALAAVSLVSTLAFNAFVHRRTLHIGLAEVLREGWAPTLPLLGAATLLAALAARREPLGLAAALGLSVALAAALAAYGWRVVLRPAHRDDLLRQLRRRPAPGGGR